MYLRTTLHKIGGTNEASGVGTYKPVTRLEKANGGKISKGRQKKGWGGLISGLASLLGG